MFRKAQPGEGVLLANLRRLVWQSTYRGIYPDEMIDGFDAEWHAKQDEARIADPRMKVWLIVVDDQPAGYLIYGLEEPCRYKDFQLCLKSLYILKAYQRQGIGRQAMEHVRAFARSRGLHRFYNQCQPQNAPAMAFYAGMGGRIGFESLGHANQAEDTVCFEYEIE